MMARQTVNLGKLAEAQEAGDAVMEAATLAVERLANAVRDPAERVTTTFRLKAEHYEYLRRAALEAHTSQQALLDEALELLRSRGRPVDD